MVGKLIHELNTQTGGDAVNNDAIARYLKDTMPAGGRAASGYLYDGNSPFGIYPNDPISLVVSGGSPLMNWIPTRYINDRFEYISHLEWVAPEGFDGSQTYAEYLASVDMDDCGGGPATDWNGFTYRVSGGRFRWQTKMMKPYLDGGMKYYEQQPIYTIRGSNIGQPLASDREWAIARLFMVMQSHYDYVLKSGERANSNMEWDGIKTVLVPGYVQNNLVGRGTPHWADPMIINGLAINNVAALLQAIRRLVRRAIKRLRMRQWIVLPGDIAIWMPATMWDQLAEHVAAGGMYKYTNAYGFNGDMSAGDFMRALEQTRSGGFGFGNIVVDGITVPVIADDTIGMNVTIDPSGTPKPGIAGDVSVLVRRANGMTLLEQQIVDWTKLTYPTNGLENIVQMPQGHVRAGWVTEANNCYYYYAEMAGRFVSYMQPLQGVIRNVVIETLDAAENEAGTFTSPDFYPYRGVGGGRGTSLLTGS
jgi:hypothetical protein